MLKKILLSFALARQNIVSRLFHTLLSVLGIVIGVAALVTILSMIDGMEKYAQEQITKTTSLKAVNIRTETHKNVNGVRLKKESYAYLDYSQFQQLVASLTHPAKTYLNFNQSHEVNLQGKNTPAGALTIGRAAPAATDVNMAYGRYFTKAEVDSQAKVAYVNHVLASHLMGKDSLSGLLRQKITFSNKEVQVIGILAPSEYPSEQAQLFTPITLFSKEELAAEPPFCTIIADEVEAVPAIKVQVEKWLSQQFKGKETDFVVATNEMRVKQAAQGFLLFRIVMGLIVGISVIVGGIGVMNVLLISVTERTVEIGVRKALGAKKQDILLQFLAESVSISLFGSFLGLVLGILSTMVIIPVIKMLTQAPFQAAYTLTTFLIIAAIAILIGIVFGTYPAVRAARLDPVEAIRRE
ncbi:ABC transporter permease [Rhodocytophaga rosea]|uniref:ABC transporter permease n=1 Tax=Rhodocytophaga rosea TaxID=2704465 RepID=A0A6C0GKJ2_9BACT|nr:ABC transporter permease [Rhodocytophaga rosea]QHT68172.1 ABC transporter permease [Rhodocytophaga rosea]